MKYDDVLAAADRYCKAVNVNDAGVARWKLENAIGEYVKAQCEARDRALEAARLLCANLRNGGVGHMKLVENFDNIDNDGHY